MTNWFWYGCSRTLWYDLTIQFHEPLQNLPIVPQTAFSVHPCCLLFVVNFLQFELKTHLLGNNFLIFPNHFVNKTIFLLHRICHQTFQPQKLYSKLFMCISSNLHIHILAHIIHLDAQIFISVIIFRCRFIFFVVRFV